MARAPEHGTLAGATQEAARQQSASSSEAGFHDVWRASAATAIASAVRDVQNCEDQPEVGAHGRREVPHGSTSALLLEADMADEADRSDALW